MNSPARNAERLRSMLPTASWFATAIFGVAAVLGAAFQGFFEVLAVTTSMALFVTGCILFVWAFLIAAGRSRSDAISIGGVYLLNGSAPPAIRRSLLGAVAAQVLIGIGTAAWRPYTTSAFGVLVPMFGLALVGLWGARFGAFAPREPERRSPRSRTDVD